MHPDSTLVSFLILSCSRLFEMLSLRRLALTKQLYVAEGAAWQDTDTVLMASLGEAQSLNTDKTRLITLQEYPNTQQLDSDTRE